MTTELEIYNAPMDEQKEYAMTVSKSALLPEAYRNNPANVLIAMEYGHSLGISPIQAMKGVHVIKGTPSVSSDLMAALVRKAGHKLRISEDREPLCVTAVLVRRDDPDFEYKAVWDIDKAQKAGLIGKSPTWKGQPGAMLRSRAVSEVIRQGASECLFGLIYTPDEVEDFAGVGAAADIPVEVASNE